MMMDDDPPEGEPPPKLLMSEFAARMLDVETQGSPLWLADRAILMLETGRPGPALTLLRELPGAIRGVSEAIFAEGKEMGRRAAQRAAERAVEASAAISPSTASQAPTAPQKPGRRALPLPVVPRHLWQAGELAEHIARLGADRVAEVLRVRLTDLEMLLTGRAAVGKTVMKRLRETPD